VQVGSGEGDYYDNPWGVRFPLKTGGISPSKSSQTKDALI